MVAVEIKWRSGEGGAPASESCRLAARHPSQLWRASPRPPPAPLAEARPGPRAEPGRRAPPPGSSRPRRLRARRRSHVGSPPEQGHEARATAAPGAGGACARSPPRSPNLCPCAPLKPPSAHRPGPERSDPRRSARRASRTTSTRPRPRSASGPSDGSKVGARLVGWVGRRTGAGLLSLLAEGATRHRRTGRRCVAEEEGGVSLFHPAALAACRR